MILVLPTRTDAPWYSFQVELEQVLYGVELLWNAREAAWYLTLRDQEDNVLLAGRKVVVGWPLTWRFKGAGLPPGEFFAVDSTGSGLDPGYGELGARVQLLYFEAADVPGGAGVGR